MIVHSASELAQTQTLSTSDSGSVRFSLAASPSVLRAHHPAPSSKRTQNETHKYIYMKLDCGKPGGRLASQTRGGHQWRKRENGQEPRNCLFLMRLQLGRPAGRAARAQNGGHIEGKGDGRIGCSLSLARENVAQISGTIRSTIKKRDLSSSWTRKAPEVGPCCSA